MTRSRADRALLLFEKEGDVEGSVRAGNLAGAMLSRRGDYKAALERLNAILATARDKLGPGHPEVARTYYEIGTVYASTGRPKEGLELLEKALALRRTAGGARTAAARAAVTECRCPCGYAVFFRIGKARPSGSRKPMVKSPCVEDVEGERRLAGPRGDRPEGDAHGCGFEKAAKAP